MGFVNQPNYSGIGPNTARMTQSQPMQQPQQNAVQYNLNRACNLINDVVGYKFQIGELNQMAANQCAANLRALFNNGSLSNRMYQQFGTNMADDNQLRSFVDYLISEWKQQAAMAGGNIRGVPQQPMYGQPMFGQPMQQPMFGQPMMQRPMYNQFGQPMQQPMFGQPMQQQPVYSQFGQPMFGQPMQQQPVYSQFGQQQPMYGQQMRPMMQQSSMNGPSTDSIYNRASGATHSSYYNSVPTQNVTANRVYTQQPQVSTYQAPQVPQAPQVQPAYQPAPVQQPVQQRIQQPRPQVVPRPQQPAMQCISTPTPENPRGFNPYGNNTVQSAKQAVKELTAQIDPALTKPKVVDLTAEEEAKLYPDDEFGFRNKHMQFIKLMTLEYHKHIYGSTDQKKAIAAKVDAQVIEMKTESAPSNTAVIKRVLAANKGHNAHKQFMYKIGFKKEVVIDMPFNLAHMQHDDVQSVWSKFIDPEDNTSVYKVLEIHQFEVAKELVKKFKTTHPDYQKAMEPIILSMYNNIMDTASIVKTNQGKRIRMEHATSIDDIHDACCLSDMSRYDVFKQLPQYSEVLANALRSSLFAVYNPFDKCNYLNYKNPNDRATALANPEIGVFISYVTDRYLPNAKVKDKPLDAKKIATMVDSELEKHFVIKVDKCVVYTNMEMPFAKKPASLSFAPGVVDAGAGGDTNIFLLHTLTGTLDTSYITSNVCIPEIVLANDMTTKNAPYVIVNTMDDYALGCRVIAAA